MEILMDGTTYHLRIRYETLGRSFRIDDGDNAGNMLSGLFKRDVIGTYYDYSMEVEADPRYPNDYDAFYEAISAPQASHSITLPYAQSTIVFDAMITSGDDMYHGKIAERNRWGSLRVNFVAQKPQRTPS